MREIKFRVWDSIYSTMTYGNIDVRAYLDRNGISRNSYILNQFTGLKDKNGKEIYEGDIVSFIVSDENRHTFDMIGEVDFEEFEYVVYTNEDKWPCVSFHVIELKNLEIIGNVYQNPELLNTKE